jgi:membrane-anchored protein YejM (alkaline phosphatase superfamily)
LTLSGLPWPTLTDNKDVMTTLMQRLLHVSTPANEYSQGEDLFR